MLASLHNLVPKKPVLIALLLAAAGLAAALALVESPASRRDAPAAVAVPSPGKADEEVGERYAALPARAPIGEAGGEPFGPRSWAPPPVVSRAEHRAPPRPAAPPMPYRVAGQVTHEGIVQVALARDERVVTAGVGERVDDLYRVEAIRPDAVTLVYLPLGTREELPVAGLLLETAPPMPPIRVAAKEVAPAVHEPRAAQLRFEGPQRVQAGTNFEVALKLSSAEPLQSAPLQLSFDAKLVQPVSVRPGELFADPRFTYRVNPDGSIFVGASGNGVAAADAEFLVVTFHPIRSGDAELRLSSVALQGRAGRAIAHEPPAAFRTAIVQ